MHNFQIQALVVTLGFTTVCTVASPADMLTAFSPLTLLSKPDVSVQVLSPGSVSGSAEGNITADDFVPKAQVISSGNKEDNAAALNAQPEYCPEDYENTPMCRDCGGFTIVYFKELEYHDTKCKGVSVSSCKHEDSCIHWLAQVGDDEYLKDCYCLEREYREDDCIGCERLGPDPDAFMRKAAEAFAKCPKLTSDSFADTEFTSVNQPYIDLGDDFWADVLENMDHSDDEQEDECLPKENI
jgi:hypothetical protein